MRVDHSEHEVFTQNIQQSQFASVAEPQIDIDNAEKTRNAPNLTQKFLSLVKRNWMASWVISTVVALLLGFLWGTLVRTPMDGAKENSEALVSATEPARTMDFYPEVAQIEGNVNKGIKVSAVVASLSNGEDSIITSVKVDEGDVVSSGDVLLSVAGKPLIALRLPFALYRDLADGDEGEDVLAIQSALRDLRLLEKVSGEFDSTTQSALQKLYKQSGIANVSANHLEKSLVLVLPESKMQVVAVPAVGSVLSGEDEGLALRSEGASIAGRLTVLDAEKFKQGDEITFFSISDTTQKFESVIGRIGGFQEANEETGETPGYEFQVELSALDAEKFSQGDTVLISPSNESLEPVRALGVPVIGIREDHQGPYVYVVAHSKEAHNEEHYQRRAVELGATQDGWVQVSSTELQDGELVVLGGVQ